jgi:hypothetical protein
VSYVTLDQLDQQLDVPVQLPLTDLPANQWLIVSTFRIDTPQAFTLRWLQLHLIEMEAVGSTGAVVVTTPNAQGECVFPAQGPNLVVPTLGLVYVGLYTGFDDQQVPSFQAAQEAPLYIPYNAALLPPQYAIRPLAPTTYAAAGVYSFVIVNNTTNQLERVSVSGQVRVNLAFGTNASS